MPIRYDIILIRVKIMLFFSVLTSLIVIILNFCNAVLINGGYSTCRYCYLLSIKYRCTYQEVFSLFVASALSWELYFIKFFLN